MNTAFKKLFNRRAFESNTVGLGDYFAGFLDEEARKQGATVEALSELRLGGMT